MAQVRNLHGRAQAFTVLTRLRPGATLWLRLNFLVGRHVPYFTAALRRLSFIHYARWGILRLRDGRSRYLLVTSNFNGTWDEYIEVFSEVVPWRIRAIWSTSYGFSGPSPPERLKRFAREHAIAADHYYAAYPHASTTLVRSALAVREAFTRLSSSVAGDVTEEEFRSAWLSFLTEMQCQL